MSMVVFLEDADGSYAMFLGVSMSYFSEGRFQMNERQGTSQFVPMEM